MATFKKGDVVQAAVVVPKGPVEALRMDDEGNIYYLVTWVDGDEVQQQRWFSEGEITAA